MMHYFKEKLFSHKKIFTAFGSGTSPFDIDLVDLCKNCFINFSVHQETKLKYTWKQALGYNSYERIQESETDALQKEQQLHFLVADVSAETAFREQLTFSAYLAKHLFQTDASTTRMSDVLVVKPKK